MSAMDASGSDTAAGAKWRPLSPRQRRVLGVLIEKAKTTPDAYPMTINAIVAGCNQKSNRDPVMNLSSDDVEDVLVELRQLGAVSEVQQGGRVSRFRHLAYEWLGVDKTELAVMAELMLRGEQTVGELRGRAARMEPIADLDALRPVLQSLTDKKLVVALTPSGRGQVVTHGLHKDREWDEVRTRAAESARADTADAGEPARGGSSARGGGVTSDMFSELQLEVAELRAELARVRERLEQLEGAQS